MKTCYIDIEGDEKYPVEVGLILIDREKEIILDAAVLYGHVHNYDEFKRARQHCHGMHYEFLNSNGYSIAELGQSVHELICENWKPNEIVAHGTDCQRYLANTAKVHITFRNCELPSWKIRHDLECHKKAFEMKIADDWVKDFSGRLLAKCDRWQVHPYSIKSDSFIKRVHGAHCALYDAMEVAFFDKPVLMERVFDTRILSLF